MTVAIIGGGPTGVELAGTIAELARRVLIEDFAFIDSAQTRVVLIEGGEHVLDTYPLELRESARRQLEKLGAEVITGRRASDIRRGEVVLGEDRKSVV